MNIKATSRINLSKLSCIIGTLNSCLPWRCAVALVLDGRALAKQIEDVGLRAKYTFPELLQIYFLVGYSHYILIMIFLKIIYYQQTT
jgi:hypothetical protein